MTEKARQNDIQQLQGPRFHITVNGCSVQTVPGETVISALAAIGLRGFSENNHRQRTGGYCWMGICHSCVVRIDGLYNRRACQTLVRPGMCIETNVNRLNDTGL
jgi:hydrogen cyanide synthase HcnA